MTNVLCMPVCKKSCLQWRIHIYRVVFDGSVKLWRGIVGVHVDGVVWDVFNISSTKIEGGGQ